MQEDRATLLELERTFWQSIVDQDTDTAIDLLCEPAFMVSPHGAMKFDHAGYRKMADHGAMIVTSFEFGKMEVTALGEDTAILSYDVTQVLTPRGKAEAIEQRMHDTSTWVRTDGAWRCAMHTETPAAPDKPAT